MLSLSQYMSRSEIACHCGCGFNSLDAETSFHYEKIRAVWGCKIFISCGCRCTEHNEVVQKERNPLYIPFSSESMHMWARAIDFTVEFVDPEIVQRKLKQMYPGKFGIGCYETFTHFDTKSGRARRW